MKIFRLTLTIIFATLFSAPIFGQVESAERPTTLDLGRQITRELKSGDIPVYLVELSAGEAAYVLVMQNGIDVIVSVYGPDEKKIKYVDSPNGSNGPEPLRFVAGTSGAYRVEIGTFDTIGANGRYDITLKEVLSAEQFRQLTSAEQKKFTEIPPPLTVFDEQRMRQNELVMRLRRTGAKYEGQRAFVFAEQGLLTQPELNEYGELVNKGVADVERYLGIKFDSKYYSDTRMSFFVSNDIKHSYFSGSESLQPFIFTEGLRVKLKSDPYLHEIAHAILGETGSAWLTEGIANYVSSYVSKRFGGYDHKVFGNRSNRGVDGHVRELLASEDNARHLPQILSASAYFDFSVFANDEQIQKFRAVAYPAAHSFVKFMVKNVGLEKMKKIYIRKDTDKAVEEITGKTKDQWEKMWLKHIKASK